VAGRTTSVAGSRAFKKVQPTRRQGGTATGSILIFERAVLLGDAALDPNGQADLLVQFAPGARARKAVFVGLAPFTDSTSAILNETVNKAATASTLTADTNSRLG
jgi:hypothetical protein